ncbi:sulfite exporter TauE/SafE family protein [Actinoplanes sp. TBRC 11911]|uniref:sulfite exporter TauE/SafE family protein n=1 Tax=Actinoplanes sp. TBRC 11911 TaxID=2729386 RepID=UPI00145F0864|nr:sulfite exporter TauE/SafE family protein [Actinoplanes sp. TBRC 11911]NMO56411.1 sulfite exporter TauE/SafE family protein [Actinoplanes sp. TBRC 11911]
MDLTLALAGFGVGIVVGLTGMGGGALMTPILVLIFGIPPVAAVSSDLAASAVMKPFGGFVHARRGTVNWALVRWLCVGSVPSAFLGVLLLRLLGDDATVQHTIQIALGVALLLAAGGLLLKLWAARRSPSSDAPPEPIKVKPLPTALLGALGGLVVGLTSVGSGSLIIVALLAMYPKLRANDLVGTDLIQAIPLVAAAALGHALFGDLQLDLAAAVVIGSVPGVLLGSRISSRAPAGLVRTALVIVLLASSLKLFNLSTAVVGVVAGMAILAAAGVAVVRRRRALVPVG